MWVSDINMSFLSMVVDILSKTMCPVLIIFFFGPGTKEDCDKEALNLSFSSSPSQSQLNDDDDSSSGKHLGKSGSTQYLTLSTPRVSV